MTLETPQISAFLTGAGWDRARRDPLVGDASTRRYERLTDPASGATAILMLSPATPVAPFVDLADRLRTAGLSTPRGSKLSLTRLVRAARPASWGWKTGTAARVVSGARIKVAWPPRAATASRTEAWPASSEGGRASHIRPPPQSK